MSLLNDLKIDDDIEESKDILGAGSYVLESGVYQTKIDLAYVDKSKGGATGLNMVFKTQDGRELRQTLWVSSGDAKGNKNYYVNARSGKKELLPGMNIANAISMLSIGKSLSELDTTEKTVKLYDFESKSEVPTKVNVLADLLEQPIDLGVIKQTVDKNVKGDDGKYVASGETREENDIQAVFRHTDGLTLTEVKAKATDPAFRTKWSEKWTGVTKDRSTGAAPANTGSVAGTTGNAGTATPSLFS